MTKKQKLNNSLLAQFVPDDIIPEDQTKYRRILANWTYLSTFMCVTSPTTEVLGVLIKMELMGKNRKDILERLVSRLTSNIRQQLKQDLAELHERSAS